MASSDTQRGILHSNSENERFSFNRHRVCEALSPFVEYIWITRWDLRPNEEHLQGVLTHPCIHAVVDSSGPSGVFGIQRGRFERLLEGRGRAVGIKFWPGAFASFLGKSVMEISDRYVPFSEVFGAAGQRYETAALNTLEDADLVALAEDLLIPCHAHLDPDAILAREIVLQIEVNKEITRVEHIANLHHLPLRKLQRLFRYYVGANPKWVIQRYRIYEAVESLETGTPSNLANLAAELGYADQAHFSRDFQRLVGKSPSAYKGDVS